jgi:hypothetical protein
MLFLLALPSAIAEAIFSAALGFSQMTTFMSRLCPKLFYNL